MDRYGIGEFWEWEEYVPCTPPPTRFPGKATKIWLNVYKGNHYRIKVLISPKKLHCSNFQNVYAVQYTYTVQFAGIDR